MSAMINFRFSDELRKAADVRNVNKRRLRGSHCAVKVGVN
jgi:hypothetical protein